MRNDPCGLLQLVRLTPALQCRRNLKYPVNLRFRRAPGERRSRRGLRARSDCRLQADIRREGRDRGRDLRLQANCKGQRLSNYCFEAAQLPERTMTPVGAPKSIRTVAVPVIEAPLSVP